MTPIAQSAQRLSDEDVERIAVRVVQLLYESKLVRRRPGTVGAGVTPGAPAGIVDSGAANDNSEYANDRISQSLHTPLSAERKAEISAAIRARRRKQGVVY